MGIHPFVQAQDNCVDVQSVDINPGGDDSSPFGFTAVGDKVFFRAFDPTLGRELFIYDCSANPGMELDTCLLYTSPSPRDLSTSRMPSSA